MKRTAKAVNERQGEYLGDERFLGTAHPLSRF